MGNYLQLYYHIIFSTKQRINGITVDDEKRIYFFIWNLLKNKKCFLYRIGGTSDHIHLFLSIPPNLSISNVIKDLKVSSTKFIKEAINPNFPGWQHNFALFSYGINDRTRIIDYIKNQKEHHKKKSFMEEIKELLLENDLAFNEKYNE